MNIFFLFLSVLKCIPHEYVKNVANEHILAAFSRKHTQTTSKEKKLDALTLTHTYHKNAMKWQSKVKPTKAVDGFYRNIFVAFFPWKNEKMANAACNIHSLFRTFQANENSKRKKVATQICIFALQWHCHQHLSHLYLLVSIRTKWLSKTEQIHSVCYDSWNRNEYF